MVVEGGMKDGGWRLAFGGLVGPWAVGGMQLCDATTKAAKMTTSAEAVAACKSGTRAGAPLLRWH